MPIITRKAYREAQKKTAHTSKKNLQDTLIVSEEDKNMWQEATEQDSQEVIKQPFHERYNLFLNRWAIAMVVLLVLILLAMFFL